MWISYAITKNPEKEEVSSHMPLYVTIMEWLLRRPITKEKNQQFILEENDVISSEGALYLLMEYYKCCKEAIQGTVSTPP